MFTFMGNSKVELLAPAGNYECFIGAIQAGADAVYLGGRLFGARAYADNFTDEEICKAILHAHILGKKVYLTVNTLIKDSEMEELIPYLNPFYETGLDGVIVQDVGALKVISKAFPDLKLHISTQMTITGPHGAEMMKDLGAVRVVPARELSLQEIRNIKDSTGLEMETFIHGAMCYCYSGQCLFSSFLGGRSGNRGRCAQPCRLPYQIGMDHKLSEECYPLSLKDMCTLSILPKLIDAGIDSFKIEGRMKKAEYAAGVTAIYRKYIDLYESGQEYKVSDSDFEMLSSLYIRSDIQEGYYERQNGKEMITLHSPAYNGSEEAVLQKIRKNYIEVPKDRIKKVPITCKAVFKKNLPASIHFEVLSREDISYDKTDSSNCSKHCATVSGLLVEAALKAPIQRRNVEESIMKLGDLPFLLSPKDLQIEMDEDCFYPLKQINELRRMGLDALLETYKHEPVGAERDVAALTLEPSGRAEDVPDLTSDTVLSVLISQPCQLDAYYELYTKNKEKHNNPYQVLYVESDLLLKSDNYKESYKSGNTGISHICDTIKEIQKQAKIYIALPHILRKKDYPLIEKVLSAIDFADGFLVRNFETFQYLKNHNYDTTNIRFDANVYCMNAKTVSFYDSIAEMMTLPYELNKKEQQVLFRHWKKEKCEKIVYGRTPMMVTANCIAKTNGKCQKAEENDVFLRDRYHKDFPVILHCKYCYNIIYNSVPLSLHDSLKNRNIGSLRLQFTTEDFAGTKQILNYFAQKFDSDEKITLPYKDYTTGHEKRGVL